MFIPLQAQFMTSCQRMNALEYITEDDVLISSFFPKELPGPIYPLIEYRIKLCAKNDTTIQAGDSLIWKHVVSWTRKRTSFVCI